MLLPRAAGLPRVMMGPRLLPLVRTGTEDITGTPDKASVGGNYPVFGMLATPPLPTVNAPLDARVLVEADCVTNRWSTTCSIFWVALEMAVLKASLTRAWTKCSALFRQRLLWTLWRRDTLRIVCHGCKVDSAGSGIDATNSQKA